MASACGVLLALATLACSSSEAKKTEAARTAVRTFFAGLPSGDCATLGPLLATGGSAKSCEDTVRELIEHQMQLVDIVDAKVDGRNPEAVLVEARVARDGAVRQEPFLLRVEHQDGGWKLRL
ncbi:hypothetical protein [Hyalangium versicolor]|uniref:hypothetical protein n=1 Tax=Hyalangium versicolor TaxID=2861190 RepID=UPI001CCB2549|nr:hypothetical protein [Hyalangium versicolor]